MNSNAPVYRLDCTHSPGPGAQWDAWIEFRPTTTGYAVWAGGDDALGDDSICEEVANRTTSLDWREACRTLLEIESGAIFGDFRNYVEVSGEFGLKADLLAACWMREDAISHEVKQFLINLSEEDLQWLVDSVPSSLISDSVVGLLERYLEIEDRSPRVCWVEWFPGESNVSFDRLVDALEKDEERREQELQEARDHSLLPFLASIAEIVELRMSLIGKPDSWASGIAYNIRRGRLIRKIEQFVLEKSRLPDDGEIENIWKEILLEPTRL